MVVLATGLAAEVLRRTRSASVPEDSQAWAAFAHQNGYALSPTGRQMTGTFADIGVHIEVRATDDTLITEVRAGVNARIPIGFHLSRQSGMWASLLDSVTVGPEIQIGDPELDEAFLIHGRDPDAIAEVLRQPSVRESLLALAAEPGHVRVDEIAARVALDGHITDFTTLELMIGRACAVAHALRAAGRTPEAVDQTTKAKPSLYGLLQRSIAAGGNSTAIGRDLLSGLSAHPCALELEVERVDSNPKRVSISGALVGGAGQRVDVEFIDNGIEPARKIQVGDVVYVGGLVETIDVSTYHVMVVSDERVWILSGAAPDLASELPSWLRKSR